MTSCRSSSGAKKVPPYPYPSSICHNCGQPTHGYAFHTSNRQALTRWKLDVSTITLLSSCRCIFFQMCLPWTSVVGNHLDYRRVLRWFCSCFSHSLVSSSSVERATNSTNNVAASYCPLTASHGSI